MKKYIKFAGLDADLENRLIQYISSHEKKINSLAEKCKKHGFSCLARRNDMMRLAVCIAYIKYTEEDYKQLGIDESILKETMSDIGIWCKNNDNKGLKNYPWIQNHLKAELFKIGRLQYQLFKCTYVTFDYSKLPFKKGEQTVFIHIPQGEPLLLSDCKDSLKMAKDFFATHLPAYKFNYFVCKSWLLYKDNHLFMKPSSNILQFQTLFEIAFTDHTDSYAIERIFGKKQFNKKRYAETTSLQKGAKEYMINGGKLGESFGYIPLSKI